MAKKEQDESKQDIIKDLIQTYVIKDADGLQEALKDLLGSILESKLKVR